MSQRLRPLGTRICSVEEMRAMDRIAVDKYEFDLGVLMENAGFGAARALIKKHPRAGLVQPGGTEILVFAGSGGNGGDAFVLARWLIASGRRVRIFHFLGEDQPEDAQKGPVLRNYRILKNMQAELIYVDSIRTLLPFFSDCRKGQKRPLTIVDGLFGTGLRRPIEGIMAETIEYINKQDCAQVVALDIPSGIHGDTGQILGVSIKATLTTTFQYLKPGLLLSPGASYAGTVQTIPLSLPRALDGKIGERFLINKTQMKSLVPGRDPYGYKNKFGHALLIGGRLGKVGSVVMAADSCHRVGAGLVTVATWPESYPSVIAKLAPETMALPLDSDFMKSLDPYSCLLIGPGLGTDDKAKRLLLQLLEMDNKPLIIDADALTLIADHRLEKHLTARKAPVVLTPHAGEMAKLLQIEKDSVTGDPINALKLAIKTTQAIVLLKGATTLISSPDQPLYFNHSPVAGMATAGSGDVLSGIITGLTAQKSDLFAAALLGVYLHTCAGALAQKSLGARSMTAPDITAHLGRAYEALLPAH